MQSFQTPPFLARPLPTTLIDTNNRLFIPSPRTAENIQLGPDFTNPPSTPRRPVPFPYHSPTPQLPLPELDIGQESAPAGLGIVLVQLCNVFRGQLSSSREAIRGFGVSPGRPIDEFVADGEGEDEDDADGVLEEVRCCGACFALGV